MSIRIDIVQSSGSYHTLWKHQGMGSIYYIKDDFSSLEEWEPSISIHPYLVIAISTLITPRELSKLAQALAEKQIAPFIIPLHVAFRKGIQTEWPKLATEAILEIGKHDACLHTHSKGPIPSHLSRDELSSHLKTTLMNSYRNQAAKDKLEATFNSHFLKAWIADIGRKNYSRLFKIGGISEEYDFSNDYHHWLRDQVIRTKQLNQQGPGPLVLGDWNWPEPLFPKFRSGNHTKAQMAPDPLAENLRDMEWVLNTIAKGSSAIFEKESQSKAPDFNRQYCLLAEQEKHFPTGWSQGITWIPFQSPTISTEQKVETEKQTTEKPKQPTQERPAENEQAQHTTQTMAPETANHAHHTDESTDEFGSYEDNGIVKCKRHHGIRAFYTCLTEKDGNTYINFCPRELDGISAERQRELFDEEIELIFDLDEKTTIVPQIRMPENRPESVEIMGAFESYHLWHLGNFPLGRSLTQTDLPNALYGIKTVWKLVGEQWSTETIQALKELEYTQIPNVLFHPVFILKPRNRDSNACFWVLSQLVLSEELSEEFNNSFNMDYSGFGVFQNFSTNARRFNSQDIQFLNFWGETILYPLQRDFWRSHEQSILQKFSLNSENGHPLFMKAADLIGGGRNERTRLIDIRIALESI